MSLAPQFCGKCGTPVSDELARFCGECGSPIAAQAPEEPDAPNQDIPKEPRQQSAAANTSRKGLFSGPSMTMAVQCAVLWAIGWLPIGILFSSFYDQKRALNPGFYAQYPRTWDTMLFGMVTIYTIGALVGGFLAGLFLYRLLNQQKLSLQAWATLPAVGWFLLWGGTLWAMTLPVRFMDDGTLIIAIPLFAMTFGALVARLATWALEKKHGFIASAQSKKRVSICWAVCGLLGVIVALLCTGF